MKNTLTRALCASALLGLTGLAQANPSLPLQLQSPAGYPFSATAEQRGGTLEAHGDIRRAGSAHALADAHVHLRQLDAQGKPLQESTAPAKQNPRQRGDQQTQWHFDWQGPAHAELHQLQLEFHPTAHR